MWQSVKHLEIRGLQGQTDLVLSDDIVYVDKEEIEAVDIGNALVDSKEVGESEDVGVVLSVSEGAFDWTDVGDVTLVICGRAAEITRAGFCTSSKSTEKYVVRRAIPKTRL
jgi:hypothetical protein